HRSRLAAAAATLRRTLPPDVALLPRRVHGQLPCEADPAVAARAVATWRRGWLPRPALEGSPKKEAAGAPAASMSVPWAGSVRRSVQAAFLQQGLDPGFVPGEIDEQFAGILLATTGQQCGAETVAVLALQTAVGLDPLDGVRIEHLGP